MKTGQFVGQTKIHPSLIPTKGSPDMASGQFVPSNYSGFYMPYQVAPTNAYDYDIDV
jgi:hypothetical protein